MQIRTANKNTWVVIVQRCQALKCQTENSTNHFIALRSWFKPASQDPGFKTKLFSMH